MTTGFTILERHQVGASFSRWPEEMNFITPSFPSHGFGLLDLNAVTLKTSPAIAFRREHISGKQYALYLQTVVDHFELPIQTEVDVKAVEPLSQGGFKISTRACSRCSRQTCMSAIAFGSVCSYQFGATLGVFSAANLTGLVAPYLSYLTLTTLIYTRLIAPKAVRSPHNVLMIEQRTFLEIPRWSTIWRETQGSLSQFFTNAIPIFLVITIIASVLDWFGLITALAGWINPLMGLFDLPPEAALPVIFASIRKDGLLLFAEPGTLAVLTPLQVLTGVYLAGVLPPCLVTALTIAREQSVRFAVELMARQAIAATAFSMLLAWGGGWLAR